MRPATVLILSIVGLGLIWLPTTLTEAPNQVSELVAASALATVGLLLLLALLYRLKRRR